jgi:hypothetical protein
VIEPNIGLIHMRFTHPPLVPPKTFGAPVPSFAGPAITAPPIAAAGSTITVSGQFFPTQRVEPTVLSVALQHDSACPGGRTDLKWGPQGGPTRWDHLPIDSCNTDDPLSNLTPGTTYQFQARDCDDSTCSQWTAPFNLTTASASDAGMGGDIPLTLDGAPLGTTKAGADGRFDKDVVIPAGTAPGNHKLRATSGHLTPETGVQVTAATGGNTTMILTGTFYGDRGCPMRPLTDKAIQMESPFSVFGAGFTPGTMTLHLDSATGIGLGSATVGADGTFCNDAFQGPPSSQLGDHTLVAVQDANVRFTLPIKVVRPSHVN